LACQRAEHAFVGVPCGIMDQFISIMGIEGHALLLDCRDLITKHIPMRDIDDYVFVITDSNTPHKLTSSAYNERRNGCYEAAKILNKVSLREASLSDLEGRMKLSNQIEFMLFVLYSYKSYYLMILYIY
jgi:galactokinase